MKEDTPKENIVSVYDFLDDEYEKESNEKSEEIKHEDSVYDYLDDDFEKDDKKYETESNEIGNYLFGIDED